MGKKAIGLSEEGILLADMTADGAIPADATFKSLGKTYKDTAEMVTEEGETIPCDSEENDDPEDEIFIPGATTLKFSTSDLDPESCHKTLGGTISESKDKWTAPNSFASKEVFVRFTTRTGLKVTVGRAKLYSRMNWAIKKNGYGLLEHKLRIMTPKASETPKITIEDTTVA